MKSNDVFDLPFYLRRVKEALITFPDPQTGKSNEHQKEQLMQDDYWLYVVFNCATAPEIYIIRNPTKLGWKPIVTIEHYQVEAQEIFGAEENDKDFL